MKSFSKKVITLAFIFLFLITVLFVVGEGIVLFYFPKTVIQFVQQFIPTETPTPLHIKGVAVIGDSQSDEYLGDDSRGLTYASTTLNWVEQLQKYRGLNFGEWGVWGEPRRTGYAYDWARTGATVNSMIESGQHVGVADQVKKGEVNLVIIYIGANDFAPYITPDGYDAIYNGSLTEAQMLEKKNRLVADITTAVDTIRLSGKAKILLVKIPDWGDHFAVRIAFPLPENRQHVSDLIDETNADLQSMADARGIATVDPNVFYRSVFQDNSTEVTVGNVKLTAVLPGDDPHSVFLDDGVHFGTVMNGLFANYLIRALDTELGASVKPFPTKEILSNAGL